MSIIRCDRCERQVDTDFAPSYTVEVPNYSNTAMPAFPKSREKTEYEEICEACLENEAAA